MAQMYHTLHAPSTNKMNKSGWLMFGNGLDSGKMINLGMVKFLQHERR